MKRVPLALFVLFAFSTSARAQIVSTFQAPPFAADKAQTAMTVIQESQGTVTSARVDDVIARLMSFDRNGDGRIAKDELSERMEGLIAEGDASGDGVLDAVEIRAVAERPQSQIAVRGFQAGHYGFGDESGESSRLHIEGVLADLKLASPVDAEAAAIVKAFVEEVRVASTDDFVAAMEPILSSEQFERLKRVVTAQLQVRTVMLQTRGPANVVPSQMLLVVGGAGMMLPLSDASKDLAVAAIERFNKRQRLLEADRNELIARLGDLLTDEQRDDLRAALTRRPIAKAGGAIAKAGVQINGPAFQVTTPILAR